MSAINIESALQKELFHKWTNNDWTETLRLEQCDSVSTEPLIVIGGCARSGTTLVRVILDSHSEVVVGPHTNVFIPIQLELSEIAYKLDLDPRRLQAIADRDRVGFIEGLASECKSSYGKRLWGEKTARNVHRFQWVSERFPNALMLHVIRDGRDAVCSLRNHRQHKVVAEKIVPTQNRMPLDVCMARWRLSIRDGCLLRGNPRYFEIRYEALINDPENTIAEICDFLSIPTEHNMLNFYTFGGPLRNPLRFPQNVEATLPIYSSAVGRWKADLTTEEQLLVYRELGDMLTELGYI